MRQVHDVLRGNVATIVLNVSESNTPIASHANQSSHVDYLRRRLGGASLRDQLLRTIVVKVYLIRVKVPTRVWLIS